MGESALRVRLLGKFEVEGVETSALGSRKGRTLLKRLALDVGTPLSVDALIDVIWPDNAAPAGPADQVSVLVSRLRRALGQDAIGFVDGSYTLSMSTGSTSGNCTTASTKPSAGSTTAPRPLRAPRPPAGAQPLTDR